MQGYDGFRAFVASRSAALARTAYLLTGDRHLAEDLLQEALARVAARWDRVAAAGDPEPYVRRVLYTCAVYGFRRRRVVESVTLTRRNCTVGATTPRRWPCAWSCATRSPG